MEAPKKGLGLLIGIGPKPKAGDSEMPPPPDSEASEGNPEAEDLAVSGMMDALESKDSAGFKDALTTFLDAAGYRKS